MSSIPFDQDQNTSDALSALSALASQASVHPGYQLQPSEDGGMGVVGGEEGGEGQLAPSGSSTTGVKFEGEHEWVMPDDHTLAAVFSGQDDTHRVHHGGESSMRTGADDLSMNDGGEGSHDLRAGEAVVQAIHAATQARVALEAASNGFGGGGHLNVASGSGTPASASKAPKKNRTPGVTTTSPFAAKHLLDNYTAHPPTTVQRTSMYASYCAVCEQQNEKPVNAATFGKAIRTTFPSVKTRRLGNRGNSRYNYCGIKASTQAELDRLVQFGNIETEKGAINPTKVKRKKTTDDQPAAPKRVSSRRDEEDDEEEEDYDEGFDDDDDEEDFDEDEEDDDDELLPADGLVTASLIAGPSRPKVPSSARKVPPKRQPKPTTVHIVEIEINGKWVPHISDGNDGYVPSDLKGNPLVPLPPALGDNLSGALSSSNGGPASLLTAPTESSTSAHGRPKRSRNSLAPDVVASMMDDSDGASSTPSGKRRGGEDGAWAGTTAAKRAKLGEGNGTKYTLKGKGRVAMAKAEAKEAEARYLGELTQGFDELRDSVPVLRTTFGTSSAVTEDADRPDPETGLVDGLAPPSTLKEGKITILTTAKEYIQHLDRGRKKSERERRGMEELFKKVDGGAEALEAWQQTFNDEEKLLAEQQLAVRVAAAAALAAAAASPPPPPAQQIDESLLPGASSLSGFNPDHLQDQHGASSSSSHHLFSESNYENLLLGGDHHFQEQNHENNYLHGQGSDSFGGSSTAAFALAHLAPALAAAQQHQQDGIVGGSSSEGSKVQDIQALSDQIAHMEANPPSSSSFHPKQHQIESTYADPELQNQQALHALQLQSLIHERDRILAEQQQQFELQQQQHQQAYGQGSLDGQVGQ